ncbi:MAG TPA: hypothetical protein VM580_09575 [Labilithrix sp.]|nr:hypothetical protein [Labilithrix sp.]
MSAFFADPNSSNVSASLSFFPLIVRGGLVCDPAAYAAPAVATTQLPNAVAFANAFAQDPSGDTPSEPALEGAITQAKSVRATGRQVAVVFATDGSPRGCGSDLNGVEAIAAQGFAAGIRTYVIGVGPNTGALDGMAKSGGTDKAIIIPTENAAQVSADLRAAIGAVTTSMLNCSVPLPAPPDGRTLDVNAVNVNVTPSGGASTTLAYSADCSDPNGWRYDDATAPKEIVLCSAACESARATSGAKLDVIFGCATSTPDVR